MRLDPRMLRQFLAVCREGTISGAAKAEHVSQPSISMAMTQLERVLDVKLFQRSSKGMVLTSAGKALKLKAMSVENLLQTAQYEIRLLADQINGPLHIGGTPGALSSVMSQVLGSFCEHYPTFNLQLTECDEDSAHHLLKTYKLDIAILTTGMASPPEEFCEETLFSDGFSLVVGQANSHLPNEVKLESLCTMRWLMPDKIGGFRHQLNALFLAHYASLPKNIVVSDSVLATKQILINTDYIALLPTELVKTELECGLLRAIDVVNVTANRKVGLLWLAERQMSPFAQAFIDHASHFTYR